MTNNRSALADRNTQIAQQDSLNPPLYHVEEQVGFLIRRAHQRASALFGEHFLETGLSPVQFAALTKVRDEGRVSQNELGRLTYVDPATIAGVVSRLISKDLVRTHHDPNDKRRRLITITSGGLKLVEDLEAAGHQVTEATLKPLNAEERRLFLSLLTRLT